MWRRHWPWLVLLLVPLLAHAPELAGLVSSNPLYIVSGLGHANSPALMAGLPWIDPNTGYTTQALGALSARDLMHGHIGWWNHFSGVGMPLGAEMQSSALFIPFVLLLGALNGVLILKIVLQILSGLATFALLRELGIVRGVAVLCAALFELNGTFAWLSDEPIMPVAFLPVILLGMERARSAALGGQAGGWGWLAAGIAYAFYSGFPETSVIYLLLAVAWAIWRLCSATSPARSRLFVKLASGGVCAMLLAGPIILPFLQYLPRAYLGPHGLILPGLVSTSAASLLFPAILGPPDYDASWVHWGTIGGSFSLPLAAIASLALLRRGRDFGLRVLLVAWCAIALAKSANLAGITQAFDIIPFMRLTWFARYCIPSLEMAGIILAAYALDDWHRGVRVNARAMTAICVIWALAAFWSVVHAWPIILHLRQDHTDYPIFLQTSLATAAIISAAAAAILARRCTALSHSVLSGMLIAQALAIALLPLAAGVRDATYDKTAVKFLQKHLGLSRFYTLGPLAPNYGAFFAVASINHDMLPVPRLWVDYVRAHLDPAITDFLFTGWIPTGAVGGETRIDALRHRLDAYSGIGVKYVLATPGTAPFGPDARVYSDPTLDIYELPNPAPYFEARGGPCRLAAADWQSVRAICGAPAQLVRRELFYPGWHARAAGAEMPIFEADGLFEGVQLPAGETSIAYDYAPPGIGWAYLGFGLGIGWLMASRKKAVLF